MIIPAASLEITSSNTAMNMLNMLPLIGKCSQWNKSIMIRNPMAEKTSVQTRSFPASAVTIECPAVSIRCLEVPNFNSAPNEYISTRITIISKIPGSSIPVR